MVLVGDAGLGADGAGRVAVPVVGGAVAEGSGVDEGRAVDEGWAVVDGGGDDGCDEGGVVDDGWDGGWDASWGVDETEGVGSRAALGVADGSAASEGFPEIRSEGSELFDGLAAGASVCRFTDGRLAWLTCSMVVLVPPDSAAPERYSNPVSAAAASPKAARAPATTPCQANRRAARAGGARGGPGGSGGRTERPEMG